MGTDLFNAYVGDRFIQNSQNILAYQNSLCVQIEESVFIKTYIAEKLLCKSIGLFLCDRKVRIKWMETHWNSFTTEILTLDRLFDSQTF